jgi:TolA-binding protein
MNRKKLILIFGSLLMCGFALHAQVPFIGKETDSEFNRAMELFNKEKYPSAITLFDSYLRNSASANTIETAEAEYFSAVAAARVFNSDAEYRMEHYIATHPESPRINEGRLLLADYFYQTKSYKKACNYYNMVNRQKLDGEKLTLYFFRYGYSSYMKGDRDKALLMFSEIKDIDTEYTAPAIYYYSQIAYEQKMYETALEGFKRLSGDETFGAIVPFYIVQILYMQKDYDGILQIAPDLLKSAGKERSVELDRFIGDAYFNKGSYNEALPYLEKYAAGAKATGREDRYQLGYCYFKTGNTEKAITLFLTISAQNDILSQNVWNMLGECYIQKGDKKRAMFAFGEASKLNFDKTIREEALFNFAKLTYETGNSPFGEAIAAFQNYIDNYPGSERVPEVYDYLVATYLQIKNYKAALSSLDKILNKDPRLQEAYQRVAFYRGLELLKNMEIEASIDMFEKSLKYQKYSMPVRARTIYWRGEAYYRLGDYERAKEDYEAFTALPGIRSLSESKMIEYNLGSVYYNLKQYPEALSHFRNFESDARGVKPEVISDARNRIADCYYITTDYQNAIGYYEKVIGSGLPDGDYATYQKGFSLGLMNNNKSKIDVLTALVRKYPNSTYVPNAIFERGRAYVVLEDNKNGEADFNTVISNYPSSPFVPRAYVQLGLLYYNLGQNDKAIAQYKKVIENFKSSPEARYAMTGLKNAYVDNNDVQAYFSYLKNVEGSDNVDMSQKDSLMYTSGENLYITSKYDRAKSAFQDYLNEFPNGSFRTNAQYYLAEILRSSGNKDEALRYYSEVASVPNNQFMEPSLEQAAALSYDKEDYEASLSFYEKLELAAHDPASRISAIRGELRSSYQSGDAHKTIAAAEKISSENNVPEELTREANFMNAKANYSLNNFDEALRDFRKVAREVTSAEGAESKYRVAELLYKKDQVNDAEKVVNEFIDQNTPHQYWMARVFLLLADISIKKGDTLQARATLQGLKDNYSIDNDGIQDEVKGKLAALGDASK